MFGVGELGPEECGGTTEGVQGEPTDEVAEVTDGARDDEVTDDSRDEVVDDAREPVTRGGAGVKKKVPGRLTFA